MTSSAAQERIRADRHLHSIEKLCLVIETMAAAMRDACGDNRDVPVVPARHASVPRDATTAAKPEGHAQVQESHPEGARLAAATVLGSLDSGMRPQAERLIERLRGRDDWTHEERYAVGQLAVIVGDTNDATIVQLARALEASPWKVRSSAPVSRAWSKSEFGKVLKELQGNKSPLSWSHLERISRHVLRVSDAKQRNALRDSLVDRVRRKRMRVADLETALKEARHQEQGGPE